MFTLQSYDSTGSDANASYSLVTAVDGVPVINSMALAEGLGIAHRALIATIKKHLSSVERFGRVLFQKAPLKTNGGTQLITRVDLNENQALFVGSLSDNSPQVVDFKVRLIEEFDKARKALMQSPHEALVKLTNELLAEVTQLRRGVVHTTKQYGKAYEAKVQAEAQYGVAVAKKRERIMGIISTRVRFSLTLTWKTFWEGFGLAYNVDTSGLEQRDNEHLLDTVIRLGYINELEEFVTIH